MVLLLGFTLTLSLWLFAGYRLTRRMGQVDADATNLNARFVHAQESLAAVRSGVLRASVAVRDALLDPGFSEETDYDGRFEKEFRAADQALRQYAPVLDSAAERASIDHLTSEVAVFRQAMLALLTSTNRGWPIEAKLLLQRRAIPTREVVIRLSEEAQAVNLAGFAAETRQMAAAYRAFQRDAWRQLGFALAASLAIALWAGLYASRLETRLRQQRLRDLRVTDELHRLSAKLVSAQEDERRMIARELHDEVGQALLAIRVAHAQPAAAGIESDIAHAREVRTITENALQRVRSLSHLLHPSLLDELGLVPALDSLLRGFGERHGVAADMHHENMAQRLAPELETAVYRIVQEALTNVAKHARANACRVTVRLMGDTVLLTVYDNGSGFIAPTANGPSYGGLGLIGIRERVVQLGGTLHLDTAPGRGTKLTATLPARLRHAERASDAATAAELEGAMVYDTAAHLSR